MKAQDRAGYLRSSINLSLPFVLILQLPELLNPLRCPRGNRAELTRAFEGTL